MIQWRTRIIEPLDGFAVKSIGLTVMIDAKDNIKLRANTKFSTHDFSNDEQIDIDITSCDSELSAKRKIKALNLACADTSEVAKEMQRYLLARDFHREL